MTIFDIDAEIMSCVDMETGEIIDAEKLDALQMERDKKVEGVACWYKQLKAEAEAIKAEKLAMAERQRITENKAESLKKYLLMALDGQKFTTGKVNISYRKSESVDVADIHALEIGGFDEYLKYSEPTADKAAIKKALKEGKEITGCSLIESVNIQIK